MATTTYSLIATQFELASQGNGFKLLAGTWTHPATNRLFRFEYTRDARRTVYDGSFESARPWVLREYDVSIQCAGTVLTGHGMNIHGRFTLNGSYDIQNKRWVIDKTYTPMTIDDIRQSTDCIWNYVDAHTPATVDRKATLTPGEIGFAVSVAFKDYLYLLELSVHLRRASPPFRVLVDAIAKSHYGSKKIVQRQLEFFESVLYAIQAKGMDYCGRHLQELYFRLQRERKEQEELVKLRRQVASLQSKLAKYQPQLFQEQFLHQEQQLGLVKRKRPYVRRNASGSTMTAAATAAVAAEGLLKKRKYTRRKQVGTF